MREDSKDRIVRLIKQTEARGRQSTPGAQPPAITVVSVSGSGNIAGDVHVYNQTTAFGSSAIGRLSMDRLTLGQSKILRGVWRALRRQGQI